MTDPDTTTAERLDHLLAAWRSELDSRPRARRLARHSRAGRAAPRVDFLRLGRVGLYYLTADGREGAVWRSDAKRWQALDEAARVELRHGLRIARDQRAPELLTLPVSRPITPANEGDAS